jgi:glutaredoxin
MVTDEHICPYGLKSLDLLKRQGYSVEDHKLKSREETDQFKAKHEVKTTPQTFIDGKRVGGYDDLLEYFGKENPQGSNEKTYTPIIAIFSVTFGLAVAFSWLIFSEIQPWETLRYFVAISMSVLAIQKLRDLESFSNQFITYDLLGMRVVRYSYVYPFVEAIAGVGMIAKVGLLIVCPAAIFIGTVGAISVIKAVYIDKRELKCACVGGDRNVPLGFISLTENLMMMFMGTWMLLN